MIPDFKTYLKESLWADVQSQASGEVVKKEDDIDLMDMDRFFDYINEHYETTSPLFKIRKYDLLDEILIPLYCESSEPRPIHHISLEINYGETPDETEVILNNRLISSTPDVYEILRDNFNVFDHEASGERGRYITVYPKGKGEDTIIGNSFALTVVDFLLEAAESKGKYKILLKKK